MQVELAHLPRSGSWNLEQALKDPAVEEPVNRWIHRPIAFSLIRRLEQSDCPITPNQITLLSGVTGVAAAACYYHALDGGVLFTVAGALLLFVSVVLDCADGMLARLRGGGSRLGMLLDGLVDSVVGISVWYGVSHTLCGQVDSSWAWPLCALTLPAIIVHCAVYDDVKNRYLRAVHPVQKVASELPSGVERLLEVLYRIVYGGIAAGTTAVGALEAADRELARGELARPMRLASWTGLGSHLVVIYVATLLSVIEPRLALSGIAVAILLASNALTIAALASWKRAWRRIEVPCAR